MDCPACGAPNPTDALFCNQCGARVTAAATPTAGGAEGSHAQVAPAPVVPTVLARAAIGPPPVPAFLRRAPTPPAQGSGEAYELPVHGPSRRTLAVLGVLAVLLGTAFGAMLALHGGRAMTPVTPVGLLGEPSAVPPADAGAPPRLAPFIRTPRTAGTGRPLPSFVRAARRGAPQHAAPAPDAAVEPARPAPVRPAEAPPDATTETDPAAPIIPAAPMGTTADEGLVERPPQRSAGGFHTGDETDATGHMDPRSFSFVYQHYSPQVAACYSSVSRGHPVAGVILVRVRINEEGHVASTRVLSDTTHEPTLGTCVQNSMRAWHYPQPEGGAVEVDYPLRFGASH